jgi:exodeoxyribonuclease VII small subunit
MEGAGKNRKMSFSEKLERLDGALRQLEEGKLSLDEALSVFEQGTALVREAQEFLNEAEQRVTLLTREGEEVPFERKETPSESEDEGDASVGA